MNRICTYVISTLFPFFWATPSLAQPVNDTNQWDHMMSWGWGHMMSGGVMMILFWGGIILLVVLLVRWFGGNNSNGLNTHALVTPIETLKQRFAKGEIDKTEYDERRKTLSD